MPQRTIYDKLPAPVLKKIRVGMERDFDRVTAGQQGWSSEPAGKHYSNQMHLIGQVLDAKAIRKEVRRG